MTTHTFDIPAEPQSVLVEFHNGRIRVHVDGDTVATVEIPEYLASGPLLEAMARVILDAHAIGKRDGRIEAEAEFERAQRKAFPILREIASHLEAAACAAERR